MAGPRREQGGGACEAHMVESSHSVRKRKFQGEVFINWDRCKGCGFCIDFCPPKVLEFSDKYNTHGYHPPFLKESIGCTGCDLCGLYCPDFAIYSVRVPVDSAPTKASQPNTQNRAEEVKPD